MSYLKKRPTFHAYCDFLLTKTLRTGCLSSHRVMGSVVQRNEGTDLRSPLRQEEQKLVLWTLNTTPPACTFIPAIMLVTEVCNYSPHNGLIQK